MGINWKVRVRNKLFWVTLIPALLLLAQQLAALFGFTLDLSGLSAQLVAIVGTVFAILAMLGVAVDMTTEGVSDSERAMGYEEPYRDEPPRERETEPKGGGDGTRADARDGGGAVEREGDSE